MWFGNAVSDRPAWMIHNNTFYLKAPFKSLKDTLHLKQFKTRADKTNNKTIKSASKNMTTTV